MAVKEDAAWRALHTLIAYIHPEEAFVVDRARRLGCKLDELMHIVVQGEATLQGGYPVLAFGMPSKYRIVQPDGGGLYTREPRGTGPEIVKAGRA